MRKSVEVKKLSVIAELLFGFGTVVVAIWAILFSKQLARFPIILSLRRDYSSFANRFRITLGLQDVEEAPYSSSVRALYRMQDGEYSYLIQGIVDSVDAEKSIIWVRTKENVILGISYYSATKNSPASFQSSSVDLFPVVYVKQTMGEDNKVLVERRKEYINNGVNEMPLISTGIHLMVIWKDKRILSAIPLTGGNVLNTQRSDILEMSIYEE